MKCVLASTNNGKIDEMGALLLPLGLDLEVTGKRDPDETGTTYRENALIKAQAYGTYMGEQLVEELVRTRGCTPEEARIYLKLDRVIVIAEDSGLTIPVLEGLPGAHSARFADCQLDGYRLVGHHASGRSRKEIDLANNLRVLELMQGIEQPYRAAAFEICLMASDLDGNILFETSAQTTGWILPEMRGDEGFGYDPIFASDRSGGRSWAQIDAMRKNVFSHRQKAISAFMQWLALQLKTR